MYTILVYTLSLQGASLREHPRVFVAHNNVLRILIGRD